MLRLNGVKVAEFVPEIADNLTTDDSTKALSAKQGKVLNDVNVYSTLDNKVVLRVNNKIVDLYLEANVSGAITTDGIQLPNGIKPTRNVYFVGKSGDNWYQPYRIDTNGLLTARSGNTVNAIAVDWALGHTTFVI